MSMQTTVAPTAVPAGVGPRPALAPDPKIQSRHLACGALIYVRQSHPSQVQRHPESARRQYGLVERARALGWPADHITIIDEGMAKKLFPNEEALGQRIRYPQAPSDGSPAEMEIAFGYRAPLPAE